MSNVVPKYRFRFFFEYYGPCLWSDDPESVERFDYAVQAEKLPLKPETIARVHELEEWYLDSLNQDYPPDPSPWRRDECERFNLAYKNLLERLRSELGEEFEVINRQSELSEDPELNEYLADPKKFSRRNR